MTTVMRRTTGQGFPVADKSGAWTAYVGSIWAANCSIVQNGKDLTFVIHRSPEVRTAGRFTGANKIVADGWGPQTGTIVENGRRIEWKDSYWTR